MCERDSDTESSIATEQTSDSDREAYDPHQYVPDRIDILSADGLVQMHEALSDENAAKLRSVDPEEQAVMFWKMVEKGVITADLTRRDR